MKQGLRSSTRWCSRRSGRFACAAALCLLAATSARAQKPWGPARTADGQPDIQGIWVTFDSTPLEAPAPQPPRPQGQGSAGVAHQILQIPGYVIIASEMIQ